MSRYQMVITSSGVETQILPDLTAEELAAQLVDFKAKAKAEVKASANRRILTLIPMEKQSNANARANELNELRTERVIAGAPDTGAGVGADYWTDAERAEIAALKGAFAVVKAIRTASNLIEAEIDALTTSDEVSTHFASLETNPLWP